jgi:hypothetical protein
MIAGFWYKVNGARQKKKENKPGGYNLGRENNARIRSLRFEIDQLMRMCSQR